jgi:hypothetical protein
MAFITGIGLLGCITFVVRYWIVTGGAWSTREAGRFLMAVYVNLAALFALVLMNQIWDDWPGKRPITFVLFAAYVIETWWPMRLLHNAQNRRRDGRKADS